MCPAACGARSRSQPGREEVPFTELSTCSLRSETDWWSSTTRPIGWTHRATPDPSVRYRLQGGAYAHALQRVTGKRVKEVVFLYLDTGDTGKEVRLEDLPRAMQDAESGGPWSVWPASAGGPGPNFRPADAMGPAGGVKENSPPDARLRCSGPPAARPRPRRGSGDTS